MKKLLAGMLALMLCVSAMPLNANAEGESVNVKVTISDKDGNAVLQQKSVTVTDIDGDGALTINDALYIAHEENFEGGAEAGYESAKSEYGYGITKLWGTANGGSYGYYVNHIASTGVGDTINDGDYLDAFVYTDLENWSDKYTFFDALNAEVLPDISLPLTLSYAGYDENWNPVTLPVEGAVITINGEKTDFVTDANGYVEVRFENAGEYVVSAVSDNLNIVKPVLPVTVNATGLEPTEPVSYGDVNLDGEVDVVDVLIVNKYLLGVAQLEGDSRTNADVDKNGIIEDADAIGVLDAVVNFNYKLSDIVTAFIEGEFALQTNSDVKDLTGHQLAAQAGGIFTAGKGAEIDAAIRLAMAGLGNDVDQDILGLTVSIPVCMRIKL